MLNFCLGLALKDFGSFSFPGSRLFVCLKRDGHTFFFGRAWAEPFYCLRLCLVQWKFTKEEKCLFGSLKYVLQTCPIDFPAVFSLFFSSVLPNKPQIIFKNSEKNSSTILKLFMNPSYVSQPFHLILGCKFIL